MDGKLFESELKVMELLWRDGEATARDLAAELGRTVGWSKTTAYTVIKKCVDKGAASREEPGFRCRPLVSREEVRTAETDQLINRLYGGSADRLVASLLDGKRLSAAEIARLKELVEQWEE